MRATPVETRPRHPGHELGVRERVLYHQIHPLKLAVDVCSSVASSCLLWSHQPAVAMLVGLLPSIVVTAVMVRWLDFRRQRDSAFGRYVAFHMTRLAEAVRFSGQIVVWGGAWMHAGWAIAAGAGIIVLGWVYSLPRWRRASRSSVARPR